MLAVDRIDAFYGHVQALRGVSLDVGAGEMVALFGANGAGKTTTLRAISGLLPLAAGSIAFDGRPLAGTTPEQTARLGIAHIPEGRGIFPRMSVTNNLRMGGYAARLSPAELTDRMQEALSEFPRIRARLTQPAGVLSGGEQQMLVIARALISRPRLLMLDEPSHGLAPKIVTEVFELLSRLRETGMALLIVEQYASVALSFVDRAYVLEQGRVVLSGDSDEMRRDWQRLAGAYLGA